LTTVTSWPQYLSNLRKLLIPLAQKGLIVSTPVILHWEDRSLPKRNMGGFVSIDPGIEFPDGARLKVHEKVRIDGTTTIREVYSYSYRRPQGYFFRFDKEPSSDLLWKPVCHLHVVTSLPHFPSPCVSLPEVLDFILTNFYSRDSSRRTIIGQRLELTI
jgi:hypothetical protein